MSTLTEGFWGLEDGRDMDSREVLLILHLIGAFLLTAGAGAATAFGIRAGTTTNTHVIAATTGMSRHLEHFVIMPGALVALVFGTWLVIDGDFEFSAGWISAAYALWIISVLLGNLVLARHAKRVNLSAMALLAEGVEESEALRLEADEALPKATGILLNIVIVIFIYLMVARPGS
jgi:uncharacterized membrane protein